MLVGHTSRSAVLKVARQHAFGLPQPCIQQCCKRCVVVEAKKDRKSPPGSTRKERRGFGETPQAPSKSSPKNENAFDSEGEEDEPSQTPSRSEYQIYRDAEYKPQRFVGSVDVANLEGKALVCL